MSFPIKQTLVMIRANLLSLPRRLAISLSMVLSVALVVGVLAGFLSMAKGFETALSSAGSPSVAVILGGGTSQEMGSEIPASAIRSLGATSGDIGAARNALGALVFSRELVVPVELSASRDGNGGADRTVALRGMDAAGLSIREAITLSQGRQFSPGTHEVVVGDRIAGEWGLAVGDKLRLGTVEWTVAGRFAAHGSAFESEIWAHLDAVQSAFDRQGQVQSLRLRLSHPSSLQRLQDTLSSITATPLLAISEADLYASQSGRVASLITLFGWPIALLMAVGATAGALNTMMSSLSDRAVEIATVRALGFSRLSAFLATWAEAALLAGAGTGLGLVASWFAFNGWQASTLGANNASMAFQLTVTQDVLLSAGWLGMAIGLFGGAFPAIAATRLPITVALRARG
jgi:putative ABC transport system permease protein